MPLSSEQVFNHLTGEEVKEILIQRFSDLLDQVTEMDRRFTLPRVQMNISVYLLVWGRNPPEINISNQLTVRVDNPPPASPSDFTIEGELESNISADTDSGGFPPDQLRDSHNLPVMTPTRTAEGIQDIPVHRPYVEGGKTYASRVELDRGGPVLTGAKKPIDQYLTPAVSVISTKNPSNASDRGPEAQLGVVDDRGVVHKIPKKERGK